MMDVLVIDDDLEVARVTTEILHLAGYRAMALGSIAALDTVCFGEPPRLILFDIMLNGSESGIDAARRLRGRFSCPFVGFSASGTEVEQAEASGEFDALLNKPFEIDYLVQTVKRFLPDE